MQRAYLFVTDCTVDQVSIPPRQLRVIAEAHRLLTSSASTVTLYVHNDAVPARISANIHPIP